MTLNDLLPFATTFQQKQILTSYAQHRNTKAVAQDVQTSVRTVQRVLKSIRDTATRQGMNPSHDMNHPAPDGFFVKGVSTYYDEDGNKKAQWVKTSIDADRQRILFKEMVEGVSESLPILPPTPAPKGTYDDLVNLYPVTDYHFGMLAHALESGEDWDIEIAENLLLDWFKTAIAQSPNASHGIFAQLGDFLHYDSLLPVTPSHGHVLDASARYPVIVRSAVRCLRHVIDLLLQKHQHLTVIMAEGNHDMASSVWLREMLSVMYEQEPRITIDNSMDPYYCFEWGKTSLFFHHGHLKKIGAIDDVFAAKFRDVFGRTQFSYAHMGHLHSVDVRETNLMLLEQHRTLAPRDAYANRGGWVSDREAKVITYSKSFGEVSRLSLKPEMLKQ